MGRLTLFLLGPPRIEYDGEPIQVNTRKAIALLVYLAVVQPISGNPSHPRDALATLFWPESDQARARANLRQTLSVLKKALDGEWLEIGREDIALRRGPSLWLDTDRFHSLLATCRTHGHPENEVCGACLSPLGEAVTLYRDDFLTGFTLRDSPGFDEWQSFLSDWLRHEMSGVLKRLVHGYSDRGEFELAIKYAQHWLVFDPLHEPAHRQLIQLYVRSGRRAAALRQYETCVRVLKQELNVPPQEETSRLHQAILESSSSSVPSRPVYSHNLPHQTTPLIGREEELAEIGRLLEGTQCRLLTLTGPGGIGKTHLALQAAMERMGTFPGGVYFVSLAPLNSADAIVPAIVDALRLSFHGSQDLKTQLFTYLREKAMLLVLDNFEHLLKGAKLLTEILQNAPEIKILTTSRERLNLKGEWSLQIYGLEHPDDEKTDQVEKYSAVQLFVQNARRIYPGFQLAEEKPAIVHICRLTEGMPLAIELAAACVRVLPCAEIAQEIEHNLSFLVSSRRDIPERHRSLQATFDHSWRFLSKEERRVFRALSVFHRGFERETAKIIARASFPTLLSLADKSFLHRTSAERYEMLQILKQYGRETLQQNPREWNEVHNRHCDYYVEFLLQREDLMKEERQSAVGQIEKEIDNVRMAWEWAGRQARVEQIAKCLDGLFRFYKIRGWFREGERVFGNASKMLQGVEPSTGTRAVAYRLSARQGMFCVWLGRYEKGKELLAQSLDTFRSIGEWSETIFCLTALASAAVQQESYTKAYELFEQALSLSRSASSRQWEADSLRNLGVVAGYQNDYVQAIDHVEQALCIYRELNDQSKQNEAINDFLRIGDLARLAYAHTEAIDAYQRTLALLRDTESRADILEHEHDRATRTLMKLGLTYHHAFDLQRSRQAYEEGLALWRQAVTTQPVNPPPPATHPLRIAWIAPPTLDPAMITSSISSYVINELFSGLMELNPELDAVPDMAQTWEGSVDGHEYIFYLRDDAYWSDGTPVTAGDFEYSWKRMLDPITDSPCARLLYDIKGAKAFHQGKGKREDVGVQALDATTLVVKLEGPTSYLPQLMTRQATYPVPRHIVEVQGRSWTESEYIVTNGAFRIESWRRGHSMVLVRNPEYSGRFTGNVQEVKLHLLAEWSEWPAALEMYEADELDILILRGQPAASDDARQRHAGEYIPVPRLFTSYIAFDVRRPPFDDVRVRQAFAHAIDKEILADVTLRGLNSPATGGFVPPGMPGHSPGIGLPYDIDRARRLLAEAGYPDGHSFPDVDAVTRSDTRSGHEYLQMQWQESLGINITWEAMVFARYIEQVLPGRCHTYIRSWIADYPDPDSFLRVGFPWKQTGWRNKAYTELIEKARRATDQETRIELYQQADRILVEEAPIIPLTYWRSHLLVKPWIKRFPTSATKIWFWKDVIIESR